METSGQELYGVIPFDGTNYVMWCKRVSAVFAAKGLDIFLEREPDAGNANDITKGKKAYALILSLLNDQILASLESENTANLIWKKLQSTYESKGAVSQIITRKRLATIKKNRDINMRKHLDNMLKLVSDLRISGAEVSDLDIIVYILMSLPPEYDTVKTALENQPNANLTLDFVSQRLIDAEILLNDSKNKVYSEKSSFDNAAFSTSRKEFFCDFCKKKGHSLKFCRKKIICFQCGKPGHIKRNCKSVKSKVNENAASAISFIIDNCKSNYFVIDSGSTSHMCSHKEWFSSIEPSSGNIKCASRSTTLEVTGIGKINGKTSNGIEITLNDVLYVPDLNGELISVKNIEAAGFSVIFKKEKVFIEKDNNSILFGHRDNRGQYICDFTPEYEICLSTKESDDDLWHRRLGHSSDGVLKELGFPTPSSFCEVCVFAKQSATPMGKGPRKRETKPMTTIHTDVCGPIVPATHAGENYFMTITDDYSRFVEVRLLKRKSDVANELNFFFKTNPSIIKIRCDNAKEYVTGELLKFATEAGVKIDPTPPYTSFLNGVAERANRTLLDKGRALILESKLPKTFWGEAVLAAAYLINRIPNQSIENSTPYQLKYGNRPDLNNIRVFGCDAYILVPKSQRKKLDEKSKKMIFVGYSTMGYRLMDPETKRIVVSRNVKFNEEKKTDANNKRYIFEENRCQTEPEISTSDNESNSNNQELEHLRRSKREKSQPVRYPDPEVYEAMIAYQETLCYEDIASLPDEEQRLWKEAMDEEMESMKNNDVWDLEELPPDKKSISCKWILRQKRDGKYKARLVARGFMQKEGVNYNETYSPVISMPALRLILVIILQENLNVFVLDVKTAFLNGDLNEIIFMDQAKGYDDNSGRKCKLKKSIYGLKQAPRQWYVKFLNFVLKIGFKQLNSESCIFIRSINEKRIILALYVDDLLIAGSDTNEINVIINLLATEFQMSKSEKASEFLGIRIEFNSNEMLLDQESYIMRLLQKFNMLDCKPCATPIEPKSTPADFEKGTGFNGPYRELVGSLLYLAYTTRPDILYAVNCLSQLQEHPTDIAWCALKKILRYLKGTAKLKLMYTKCDTSNISDLSMYVDADWGANPTDRKSVSGYIIMIFNCIILWSCRKQKCIALSSTEAEVIALGKSLQDLLWIKGIAKDIVNVKSVTIFEDNQSCIKCVTNDNSSGRLKHIDIKLKFIRDAINVHNIKIEFVPSDFQIADMMTKSLAKTKFYKLLSICNLKFC